ncbi:MAG: hypothetical protein PQJ46_14450 [Spirochaetales bacterium]|nr:hypothetical protein [Spirochaetales bacterium]
MDKTKASRNGIQKTTPVFLWISALFKPGILVGLGKTLGSIFSKFFFLQFQTVLFPKKRPVVKVDHLLDESIPFDTSWIGLYNTFTVFWMKSAGWLLKKFGRKAAADVAEFTNEMALLYNAAGSVYEKCQSTTNRPGIRANFHFIIIHTFDPHLHCVPSLHVMVCSYTAFKVTEIIKKHADNPEDYMAEIDWVFENSLAIIESVLLVKQHSVNCVPAGYYMNSVLFPNFKDHWAERYLDGMFKNDSKGVEKVSEVRSYMTQLYDMFIKENSEGKERDKVLLDFLENYKSLK